MANVIPAPQLDNFYNQKVILPKVSREGGVDINQNYIGVPNQSITGVSTIGGVTGVSY